MPNIKLWERYADLQRLSREIQTAEGLDALDATLQRELALVESQIRFNGAYQFEAS